MISLFFFFCLIHSTLSRGIETEISNTEIQSHFFLYKEAKTNHGHLFFFMYLFFVMGEKFQWVLIGSEHATFVSGVDWWVKISWSVKPWTYKIYSIQIMLVVAQKNYQYNFLKKFFAKEYFLKIQSVNYHKSIYFFCVFNWLPNLPYDKNTLIQWHGRWEYPIHCGQLSQNFNV